MKKVSIIVPVYNAESYLEECLDSVCGQTYQALEIIVVDDGSKDSTASLVKKYSEIDNRILPHYNENHGVSYSRNFGLEHCTGEYVTFVDSDDIVAPDFVEQLVHDLEDSDADMAVVGVIKSRSFKPGIFTKGESTIYKESEILENLFGKFEGFVCNKLYKRSLFQTNGVRLEENIAICEDLLFNAAYLVNCKKVTYNSGSKYFYRQIENSASNRLDNPKWFDAMKAYQKIFDLIKDYPSVYKIVAFRYAMYLCSAKYRLRFINGKKDSLKYEINKEKDYMRSFWKDFTLKQRLKLCLFSLTPGVVIRYQRRKL